MRRYAPEIITLGSAIPYDVEIFGSSIYASKHYSTTWTFTSNAHPTICGLIV
jgi:hypothetical protein